MIFELGENKEQTLSQEYQEYEVNFGGRGGQPRPRTDTLADVANKLGEARLEAEGLNDRLFLYLIDVAIFHAYEMLEKLSDLGEQEKWG